MVISGGRYEARLGRSSADASTATLRDILENSYTWRKVWGGALLVLLDESRTRADERVAVWSQLDPESMHDASHANVTCSPKMLIDF